MIIAKDQEIEPGVMDFGLPYTLFLERDTEPYKSGDWLSRVVALRQRAKDRMEAAPVEGTGPENDFWLCLQPTVIVEPYTLREALSTMMNNVGLGGLGLWTKPGKPTDRDHVTGRCALFRKSATQGLIYRRTMNADGTGGHSCECLAFHRDLMKRGYKVNYHPTLRAVDVRER